METKLDKQIVSLNDLDITNSIDLNGEYKTVLQRYYKPMFLTKIGEKVIDHQCVLFHSNRICLVTIAPSHPIIVEKKSIIKIDFVTEENVDRLKNKVSGKGKRGGQKLEETSILCKVECDDASTYTIYSCVKGKLIEINKNLIENPNLLATKYNTYGHIAIILTDLSVINSLKNSMLDEDTYKKTVLDANI